MFRSLLVGEAQNALHGTWHFTQKAVFPDHATWNEPSTALFMAAVMSSMLAGLAASPGSQAQRRRAIQRTGSTGPGLSSRQVKSTTETSGVGTRKAMPVNLPQLGWWLNALMAMSAPHMHQTWTVQALRTAVGPWPFNAGITLPTASMLLLLLLLLYQSTNLQRQTARNFWPNLSCPG